MSFKQLTEEEKPALSHTCARACTHIQRPTGAEGDHLHHRVVPSPLHRPVIGPLALFSSVRQ